MTEECKKEFDNLCLTFESGIPANFKLALIMTQNYKEEFEIKYEVCYEDLVEAVDNSYNKYMLDYWIKSASPTHPYSNFLRYNILMRYVSGLLQERDRRGFFWKAMNIAKKIKKEFCIFYGISFERCCFLVQYDGYRFPNIALFKTYLGWIENRYNGSERQKEINMKDVGLFLNKNNVLPDGVNKVYFDEAEFMKETFPDYNYSKPF